MASTACSAQVPWLLSVINGLWVYQTYPSLQLALFLVYFPGYIFYFPLCSSPVLTPSLWVLVLINVFFFSAHVLECKHNNLCVLLLVFVFWSSCRLSRFSIESCAFLCTFMCFALQFLYSFIFLMLLVDWTNQDLQCNSICIEPVFYLCFCSVIILELLRNYVQSFSVI